MEHDKQPQSALEEVTGTKNPDGTTSLTLPSGKQALIRPFKGSDVMKTQLIQQNESDPSKHTAIFMSQCCEIDGKKVHLGDLEDMDGWDYMALQAAFANTNPTVARMISSSSPTSPTQA